MAKCFIIDSSNIFYRSFYGIRPMYTSQGKVTNALYGFCRTVLKIIKDWSPDILVAAWEGGIEKRLALDSAYKQNRQKTPDDLVVQKEYVLEFLSKAGIPVVSLPEYEADDVIIHMVNEYAKAGHEVYIVSSDKDFHSLLKENIYLYNPASHEIITRKDLEALYGCAMQEEQFFLYYALMGDASDNIPGVKGIGEKTAKALLLRYKNLEELYEKYEQDPLITSAIKRCLEKGKEAAYRSYRLVKPILFEGSLAPAVGAWEYKEEEVYSFFNRFEFFSLLPRNIDLHVLNEEKKEEELPHSNTLFQARCVTDENLKEALAVIQNAKVIAIDTETTGGDRRTTTLIGFSFSVEEGEAWYVPLRHAYPTGLSVENGKLLLQALASLEDVLIVMHHALFDLHILAREGVHFSNTVFDTLVAAHLLRVSADERIGLKELSRQVLGSRMDTFSEIVEHGFYKTFAEVPMERAVFYAAGDAHQTFLLYKKFKELLDSRGMNHLFYDIEMPVLRCLYEMERVGIPVDRTILIRQGEIIANLLGALKNEIEYEAGMKPGALNIQSNQQISTLLFEKLGLTPVQKKVNKTGSYSTDQLALELLAEAHPIVDKIVRYRALASIKGRCVDNLLEHIRQDGRIYTSFNQTHVATGRLSSSDPNMQNIPRDPEDKSYSIRSAFVAPQERSFIALDYSQIELRVLAHLSQDQALIQTFLAGRDVHRETAARIYGTPLDEVTDQQRYFAKRINFGVIYGLTAYGLSHHLRISKSQAATYLKDYQMAYPRVFEWMEEVKKKVVSEGYVTTAAGRRRYIKGAADRNQNIRAEAGRIAVNTAVQGSAAELVKLGMINTEKVLDNYPLAHLILQIHDEILIEVSTAQALEIATEAKSALENVVKWSIPLEVSQSIGKTWASVT